MNRAVNIFVLFVTLAVPSMVECISVIGPRVLRPYSTYKVGIAGGTRPTSLYVAIEGKRANGEDFSQGREVQVQVGASRIIELEIGDPGPGHYELVARSTSGPQFSSTASLFYHRRTFCVFIQTDKRVYQPGDIVNFRVVALDKFLLPLDTVVDISVIDSGGSSVWQWAGVPLDRGIIVENIALADQPALGEWRIQVEIRGQTYSQQILVADYVIPKFQMTMELPKEILFTDGRFTVNITAKHFNGLPVRGELTLSAYAVFFSGLLQPVFSSPSRKVVDFDGQANIVYDLKTDLDLAEDAARPLVVEAVLEEKDTLIKQNISSRILLLRAPYRLKVTAPDYFKPTLPYNVQVEVVDSAGRPMEISGEIMVERLWDDGALVNVTTMSLTRGHATYSLKPDVAHTNSTLNLVIKYKEISERVVNVRRSTPSNGQFLTIELLTRNTSVGDDMRARVAATEPMDILHYAVIGRGDILLAKTIELNPARREVDITVPVEARMAPGCVLLVWYPRLDATTSTTLAAALYAPQNKLLQHQISVSVSGAGYRPGGPIEFQVSGEAGAHAALLVEDSAALVTGLSGSSPLGSGLSMRKIEREVESFVGLKHSLFNNEDHLPAMGFDLGGNTTADVFRNTGVVFLSEDNLAKSNSNEMMDQAEPAMGTRPPLAGPYAFSRLPPPPSPRFYLIEVPQPTWMLANFSLGFDGKGVENHHAPAVAAEWRVGAFAVHPTLGLGLASPEVFTTSVPLIVTAELPATLQKGETLAAVIILKSTLTVDTAVEVTFHNSEQYFEFEPLDNSVDSSKKIELFRRARVTVPARGVASTAFLVSTVRTGDAPVIVECTGNGVSASLFRTIQVKDGYEQELAIMTLLDARRGIARGNVTLQPQPGTRLSPVSLVAAGDLIAPALKALKDPLVEAADPAYALRPLAVAAILLDYLKGTQREGEEEIALIREARAQAAYGFQRLMAYRRLDGSFAPDLEDSSDGDIWMTAVSARWLARSFRYVPVSPEAATAAARWLARMQSADGSWSTPSVSRRSDPRAQTPIPLTAHALLALLQTQGGEVLYKNAINKATDYVARNVNPSLDAYTLAVAANALARVQHPQASSTLQMIDKYANTSATTLFWSRKLTGNEWRNPWLEDNSLEASTAAFALRAMLALQLLDEGVPVARYLLRSIQRKTIDPDVLDALAQFARVTKTATKLRVSVNVTGSEEPRRFTIDDDNALILQTQLVRNAKSVSAITEGRGLALVGLTAKSYTNVTAPWPRFILDPRVDQVSTKHRLQLSICVSFVPQGNETESGLALLTVELPSGYLADINTITELTSARHVVSARVVGGGSRVLCWLRAARAERCTTLAAPRALPVARPRPGCATLLDLYDSSHRARVFFQPIPSSACDVCRAWESCFRACGSAAKQVADGSKGQDSNTSPAKPGASPDGAAVAVLAPATILVALSVILIR